MKSRRKLFATYRADLECDDVKTLRRALAALEREYRAVANVERWSVSELAMTLASLREVAAKLPTLPPEGP